MGVEYVYYCDWRDCTAHVQTANAPPEPFLTVQEGVGRTLHFCTWDCLLMFAGEIPPAETIELDAA